MREMNTQEDTTNTSLLLLEEDRTAIINKYPELEKYIVRCQISKFWYKANDLYVFDFREANLEDLYKYPEIAERLKALVAYRLSRPSLREFADTPHLLKGYVYTPHAYAWGISQSDLFDDHFLVSEVFDSLIIYGIGFTDCTDPALFGLLSTKLIFWWSELLKGVQLTQVHTLTAIPFNSFPPPDCSNELMDGIRQAAINLLEVRKKYQPIQYQDIYRPDSGYTDALDSLHELDVAVFKAYGFIHEDGSLFTKDEALPLLIELYADYEAEEYD